MNWKFHYLFKPFLIFDQKKTIFNSFNYILLAQEISSFFRGHRLWHYITSDTHAPTKTVEEIGDKSLEDWETKNCQTQAWF